MSQHDLLRTRWEQHKIKNTESKKDDKDIKVAMNICLKLLNEVYPNHSFSWKPNLSFKDVWNFLDQEVNENFSDKKVIPDGGVIWMDNKYPILITEMKKQGTNQERIAEGKKKQAVGNAIERYGKNLTVFHTLYQKTDILPVIAFCHGCDFLDKIVQAKLYSLNGFHEINKVYDIVSFERIKPSSILFKLENWTIEELLQNMFPVAESAVNYFLGEK